MTLTAIAISGGIDSLAAAQILRQKGADLLGVHFVTGYENTGTTASMHPAPPGEYLFEYVKFHNEIFNPELREQKYKEMAYVARQLKLPITILNIGKEFSAEVVNYFTNEYLNGRTPNPCILCNQRIKFGTVQRFAKKSGAGLIATGHYARIERDKMGVSHLFKGADPLKDQSYFLCFLSQDQLKTACFPLGGLTKAEIKKTALEEGLKPVMSDESQDICFIKGKTYGDFLLKETRFSATSGPIKNMEGKTVGEHRGLHLFTVGQRKGINCPAPAPYYVQKIDIASNTLVVGRKTDLLSDGCRVKRINWIGSKPKSPANLHVKVRYGHREVSAVVDHDDNGNGVIRFETPQSAITPGQAAAFYKGDELLGGGLIEGKLI